MRIDCRMLQGARKYLAARCISFIVVEMLFASLYPGWAYFREIYGFLTGFWYQPVGLNAIHGSPPGDIRWCDVLYQCQPA
jgi:hypothetical protein